MASTPLLPTGPRTTPTPAPSSSSGNTSGPVKTSTTGSGSSGGGGGGGGGGGSSYDPAAAEKRAIARENEAKADAATRYQKQAELLVKQANALKIALGKEGFKKSLQTKLKNIKLTLEEDEDVLMRQFRAGQAELERQSTANLRARDVGHRDALLNASRERSEALAQATANGAGAADLLRVQGASLRNWQFNAQQVAGNYTDTRNQLLSTSAELGNSTLAQRVSLWRDSEEARATAYNSYYDQVGQVQTEVSNKLGEAASYYDMAQQEKESKTRKNKGKELKSKSTEWQEKAARQTGKSYEQRKLPSRIADWENPIQIDAAQDRRSWGQPQYTVKRAEGATLRRWEP